MTAALLLLANSATAGELKTRYLGHATLPTGFTQLGVEIGGISGLAYHAPSGLYYAICDHYNDTLPVVVYKFELHFENGKLHQGGVSLRDTLGLYDIGGAHFHPQGIDAEAIALTRDGSFFVASEGSADNRFAPFIRKYSETGHHISSLEIPAKFMPRTARDFGITRNRGFESLTLTSDERYLITASEQALAQDGPLTDPETRSPTRIVKYDLGAGDAVAEHLYWVEPVHDVSRYENGFMDNGLVELGVLDDHKLLALERSYVAGRGNAIRLFTVSLTQADDISGIERLDRTNLSEVQPARKQLLLDLGILGIRLDNVEAMAFGPELANGERLLLLASDNNFNPRQITQFIALALSEQTASDLNRDAIYEIQGTAQWSPMLAQSVQQVTGSVTHIPRKRINRGFWMQDVTGDGNPATSDAIYVSTDSQAPPVEVGDLVTVDGQVAEYAQNDGLPVTQINATRISVQASAQDLPAPVRIGRNGRRPASENIEDDSLMVFEPAKDGIDFYESLEGMRVEIHDAVVVGPLVYGEFVVVADSGRDAGDRTSAGGVRLRANDFNPERIFVRAYKQQNRQPVTVGDFLPGTIRGILEYARENFKLFVTEPLPATASSLQSADSTNIQASTEHLTIATFNAENLDAAEEQEKFDALAESIVRHLAAPDILALQEVQDNNGSTDDGVVAADESFVRLIQAIAAQGGPQYDYCQIDPLDKQDGGQPGGNIRVGFLFNPARVAFARRGDASATLANSVYTDSTGLRLRLNPGRISPNDPAFEQTRKSLAAEFEFNGHRFFLINNHLSSKRADDPLFGRNQPPRLLSETERQKQALVVQAFVHDLLTAEPAANVIVLGDLNEHEFRAPVQLIAGRYLSNLIDRVPAPERYTYIYQGNSQVLDHILVSRNLLREHDPEVDIVHINSHLAQEQRASDHDPVLVRLHLPMRQDAQAETR